MKLKIFHIAFVLYFILSACHDNNKGLRIENTDPELMLQNGVLYYKETPFSGFVVSYFVNKKIQSEIEYVKGRKHGYEKQWYQNDSLSLTRLYTKGFKTGIHKAWWENGNKKFEYHFDNKGQYHGNVKEWYTTGQVYRDFNYKNGKESGSQRLWKKNGNIKANYEVINGERFGLIGLKKCYRIQDKSNSIN
ncbi:toxin-antitoxin system YwqK family antitoxin [Aquimarina sp. 2201CG14-23]|uniref:toxin-antitoxin system YwqK family antitoxin n=1 Tax=Aquimarina mycalae TaxID=3040073 RepID=UPI002477D13D|nr:hypothetical protein [Aquimarina sp. 2201CG14-23]MDH7445564.1 hypothetical protein [Aquimarina sp. 2201CG14-23]